MRKLLWIDRQPAQALASGGKYRIGDRRDNGGRSWLTHPTGGFSTLDNVHLDGRRFVYAQDLVGVEVPLFDAPVLQGNFSKKSGRDSENHGALDLCPDSVGIHDRAAIDRADDAPDANRSVFPHFDFGN